MSTGCKSSHSGVNYYGTMLLQRHRCDVTVTSCSHGVTSAASVTADKLPLLLKCLNIHSCHYYVLLYPQCIFMPPHAMRTCAAEALCFHHVPLSVPCQHGLVRRAGESITHMLLRRHKITAGGPQISIVAIVVFLLSMFYQHNANSA